MISLTDIQGLTEPNLHELFGDYHKLPDEWKDFCTSSPSKKMQEYDVQKKTLGPAQFKTEAGPVASSNMSTVYTTTYIHRYVGLSFSITRQAIDDDLYAGEFAATSKELKVSLARSKNILGANLLNNAFSGNYPIADGQPLFSAAHPIDGGVVSNIGDVQFSEAGVEQGIIAIPSFQDLAGNIIAAKPRLMIIPNQLQLEACRVLNSTGRSGTTNNDLNAMDYMNSIPNGYKINHYLTNQAAFFIFSDVMGCFRHFQRDKIKIDSHVDFYTDIVAFKAVERYSFGVRDYLGAFGCQAA